MKHLSAICFLCIRLCVTAQNPDIDLLKTINRNSYPQWDKAMDYTSSSVYPAMAIAPATLLITGFATKNKDLQRSALKTCLGFGVNTIITTGLKYGVNRERPYSAYPLDVIKRTSTGPYSFPSGHTSYAFSLATSVSLATKKWYVAAPCYVYAGAIGYSRMRLGVHYPSDVLAGALIGAGSSWLVWKVDKWMNKQKALKTPVSK